VPNKSSNVYHWLYIYLHNNLIFIYTSTCIFIYFLPSNLRNKFSLKKRFIIQYLNFWYVFCPLMIGGNGFSWYSLFHPQIFCLIGHTVQHSIPLLNFIFWQSRWILIKLCWICTMIKAPNQQWSNTFTLIITLEQLSVIIANWVAYEKNIIHMKDKS